MLCKVCSKEINSAIFETIGNQMVCSLSCVGLLQSNNEDRCNTCQRPVWKDNYYKIDSLFYCSERCKKKAVKNHLKKFNTIQDLIIRHVENEYFKNDSPMKNLKELRKEVKEFYKDFDIDETSTIKSIPISCKSTFHMNNNQNNIKIPIPTREDINDIRNTNNMSVTQPKNVKKSLSIKKYIKKYPIIPNRLSKNSISRNNSFYDDKRALSRKRDIENYLKKRRNYSFDNQDQNIFNNGNDEDVVFHLKYVNKKRNNSINNDRNYNKRAKLKQTFLKLKNNNIPNLKTKIAKYQIPNPILHQNNLKVKNSQIYNNNRYDDECFENKENNNCLNIPNQIGNYFEKNYLELNNINNNENKEQNYIDKNNIYRYDTNFNYAKNSYY